MAVSIEWFGLSSVRIGAKIQNNEVALVADPPEASTGIKLPRSLTADIVVSSVDSPSYNNVSAVAEKPFTITHPGEYEIKNVFVYGLANDVQHTAYIIEVDDIVILHLGGAKKVSQAVLDRAENVDILLIPVGGGEVMNAKEAGVVANEIQPRLLIPIHYQTKDGKANLEGVEKFLKEMGAQKAEVVNKIKISKKDLPQEEMKVMVLTND